MAYSITISLPDHIHELLESRRRSLSLDSKEEAIVDLLVQALTQEELERQLLDGLEDTMRPLTDADWEAKRRDLIERFGSGA